MTIFSITIKCRVCQRMVKANLIKSHQISTRDLDYPRELDTFQISYHGGGFFGIGKPCSASGKTFKRVIEIDTQRGQLVHNLSNYADVLRV